MANSYKDKVLIITGGNSGIGAATVQVFLEQGAKVAVLDIRESGAESSDNRLDIKCDISSEESAEAAVQQVLDKWRAIDVLVNVAGIMDQMGRVSETTTEVWDRCFRVNVNGPFYLMRAVIKHFLSKPLLNPPTHRGSIVNVCSTASIRGAHAGAAYTASKHALLGLSRSTAWMYAKEGIRCNVVVPGGVQTNIMANSGVEGAIREQVGMQVVWPVTQIMPGVAQPVDLGRAILFLAGAESVNGAELVVDNGWTMA